MANNQYRTEIYTWFTQASEQSQLMYSAPKWMLIRMLLEDAGPVAVGTREEIVPVFSGKGILLITDVWTKFTMPPASRLFIASNTINRVQFIAEPIPWMEELLEATRALKAAATAARPAQAQEQGFPCPPIVPPPLRRY